MYRITTENKVQIASPDQVWSLTPGANHFDTEMPIAVAKQFAKLAAEGAITVELIEGGVVRPWLPPPSIRPPAPPEN